MASDELILTNTKPLTLDIIKALPKAELHCHLDGAVRIPTIIELAREQEITLPTFDVEELKSLVTVKEDCPSLVEYLRGFDITLMVLQKAYAITRVMYEVAEDAYRDGVKYLEVRFSPVLHTKEGLSLSQVMEAVCEGQAMAEFNLPITVRIIVCGMRQLHPSITAKLGEIAWRYKHKGVVAFDLAGPENGFSSERHKEAFDIVHSQCLRCTLHSGEAAGWESVMDSIRYCGAERLGHGVRVRENPELEQYVIDKRICIECCLTSNLQTKAISSLQDHPLKYYFDKGVIVSLCTDNPTVSGVTLSGEYLLAQSVFQLTPVDIVRIIDYGFRSSFLPVYKKVRLRAEAIQNCVKILIKEGYAVNAIMENTSHLGPGLNFQKLFSDPLLSNPNIGSFVRTLHPEMPTDRPSRLLPGYTHAKMTLEILQKIPKTDLHCRLDGSISLSMVWDELQKNEDYAQSFPTIDYLKEVIQPNKHTTESNAVGKSILQSVLQSKEQLITGINDVVNNALLETVTYMELMISPPFHILKGLTLEEVVVVAIETVSTIQETKPIAIGIVLYVTPQEKPEVTEQIAKLTVKYKSDGVVGFGVFGQEDIPDLEVDSIYTWCPDTIRYLKDNHISISISAGKKIPETLTTAFHDGGASRLSGAFSIHHRPDLMEYFASRSVPIELGVTEEVDLHTADLKAFSHPIRLYLDNELRITLCSFDDSLYSATRSQTLLKVYNECGLSSAELLKLLSVGYRRNFQTYQNRIKLFNHFWKTAKEILENNGFRSFMENHYFPGTWFD